MAKKNKKNRYLLSACLLGAGISILVPSFVYLNNLGNNIHELKNTFEEMEKTLVYHIADKNFDKKIDCNELYQLGLDLKVINTYGEVQKEELIKRIENAPYENYKDYLDRWNKKNSKN